MSIKKIRGELLRALRGPRTQGQLSRRLKYQFNQVYRWESGGARLYWPEFVKICRAVKVDLPAALSSVLVYEGKAEDGAALLRHLVQGRGFNEVASTFGFSRFKVQRWASGKSKVPFDVILQVIESQQTLLAFAGALVPVTEIPSLAPLAQRRARLADLFLKHPAVGGILVALDTDAYRQLPKHDAIWIGKQLGIPATEVVDVLHAAEQAEVIQRQGDKFARSQKFLGTTGFPEAERNMRKYWLERGMEFDRRRAELPPAQRGIFGFMLFAVSPDQDRRIRAELVQFTNKLTSILMEEAKGDKSLSAMNLQLFQPWR